MACRPLPRSWPAPPFLSDHCRPLVLKNVLAPKHLTVRASSTSEEYVCECECRRESHTSGAIGRNQNQCYAIRRTRRPKRPSLKHSHTPSQAPSDAISGNHLRGCLEGHTWPSPNRRNQADCQSARCGRRPLRARSRSGARKTSSSRSGAQIRARGRPRWSDGQQPCGASPSNRARLQSGCNKGAIRMQSGCNQGTISPSNRARLQPGGGGFRGALNLIEHAQSRSSMRRKQNNQAQSGSFNRTCRRWRKCARLPN